MNLADSRLKGLDSLAADERALLRCRVAAELIHAGQYEAARDALGELWRGIGERPNVEGLAETTAAEVLLQCGALTGYMGAQDAAKDLISEAQRLFEAHGLQKRVAEAEYEWGVCYWRAGALDEARIVLQQAIRRLEKGDIEQKAKIFIRSTVVEVSAGRYNDALQILDEAEHVFNLTPDALKGRWHGQRALVLRGLGTAERRADYFDRAIIEYTAAVFHFERAGHERYCASVENNLAFLLYKLGRYEEAHWHLDRAQRFFTGVNDAGILAQIRETRARIFLAEKRYEKAADAITGAVGALEKVGESALLADALTVQATIEARQRRHHLSIPTFRRAIKVAEDAGAQESAGKAALSLIEEYGASRLSEGEVYEIYCCADDLLSQTQDAEDITRLRACARIVARRLAVVSMGPDFSLADAVKDFEAKFIKNALRDAKGSVSCAAKSLGLNYQKLIYLLETRHKDLLLDRTPAKKRRRSIIRTPRKATPKKPTVSILLVEDNSLVAGAVRNTLEGQGWQMVMCADGARALQEIEGDTPYTLFLFDYDLPHVNGIELVRRVRQLPHRRRTPTVMFSAADCERAAWLAGVDAFLRKPEDVTRVAETIARLLPKRDAKKLR